MMVMNAGVLGGISVDKAYPMGSVFFGEGVNPNDAFSGTAWVRIAKGQVLVGVDESDADYSAARKIGGAKRVILSATEMPGHGHTFVGTSVQTSAASHTHDTYRGGAAQYGSGTGSATIEGSGAYEAAGYVSAAGAHAHSLTGTPGGTLGYAGNGGSHNNLQPFSVCEIWERINGPVAQAASTGGARAVTAAYDKLYPAGTLLYAMADVQPGQLYGGTWTRVKGRCVVTVDTADARLCNRLMEGGSKRAALDLTHLPAHQHTFAGNTVETSSGGAHTHALCLGQGIEGGNAYVFDDYAILTGALGSASHTHRECLKNP